MARDVSRNRPSAALEIASRDGWQLKSVTAVEVKGRVGPGGVGGILVTFERSKE